MIEKILNDIRKYNIIKLEDKILVAVSGGPDSIALVDILNKLKDILNIQIYAAHLNHMFRGEEAAGDAEFVESFCHKEGIPVVVEAINVTEYMKKTGLSSQVAAREVRYDFLNRASRHFGCNKIALGHHADDQAETILMNFMRGSGSKGLKGIELINKQYIRPLLFTRRYEIEEYCQINNIIPRIDSSNLKDVYLRNKIRHKLIPLLEKEFNPNIVDVMNQTAIIIKEESEYIEEATQNWFKQIITEENLNQYTFSKGEYTSLPMAIKRRLIIKIWTQLTGDNRGLDFKHIEKTIKFIAEGPANGKLDLPRGYVCKKEYETIKISKSEEENIVFSSAFKQTLNIPGQVYLEGLNKTIECEILTLPPSTTGRKEIVIDLDKVTLPLVIRSRLPGDRVRPLGLNGTKKLKDVLIDLKIPVEKRNQIPLVTDQRGIIWVSGIRQCAGYEIDSRTSKYLLLTLKE